MADLRQVSLRYKPSAKRDIASMPSSSDQTDEPSSESHLHASIVRWLESPATWGDNNGKVQKIETHISQVFLVGDLVYKLKKPIKFAFLDFSSLTKREHACREEVRLNRRLAPQVYLGVKAITVDSEGSFELDGQGQVVDWLVEMRRLPAERMLNSLHARHSLQPSDIDELAVLLTDFYRNLTPIPVTPAVYRDHVLSHVHGNCDELLTAVHHLSHCAVLRTQSFQLQQLHLNPAMFDQRVQQGSIVDGHGDLRPEHICFVKPIAIFDCIEFSDELRQLDRADELAFLVSECDFIGASWVGQRLLESYQQLSDDCPAAILFAFYKAYRASVRAKVAALRAHQLDGEEKERASEEAALHLAHADRFVEPHLKPLVLVVGGLSGTGKTTLARKLAHELGAELLRSDVIRQSLFDTRNAPQETGIDVGRYRPELREHVYSELFRIASDLHRERVSVILDATFSTTDALHRARSVASNQNAVFLAIECCCRPEVAHDRIRQRQKSGQDASEARPEIHDQQRLNWQPWPAEIPHCRIDTEQPLTAQFDQVIQALRQSFPATESLLPH
jgi:aminoglycoside phosphotransferase family enzyme/predicted kinase